MRGKINLDHDISPDPWERHRGLYLYAPSIDMSGDYTCKISTLQNEVSKTKKMTVYGKSTLCLSYILPPFQKTQAVLFSFGCQPCNALLE